MSQLRTIDQAQIENKAVLVRADLNVPMHKDGNIADTERITSIIPTIEYLKNKNAKIIICSHFGRPENGYEEQYSLKQLIPTLEKELKSPVLILEQYNSDDLNKIWSENPTAIILLENTRFHSGEEKNSEELSQQLASLAEVFVNDAFGAAHRAHASTVGVTEFLPSYAGLLLAKEYNAMQHLRNTVNKRPLTLVIGGAKIDTKIGILKSFVNKADNILIGGALANTFLQAAGYDIGASKAEPEKTEVAQEIMLVAEQHHERVLIPKDVIVADEVSETSATTAIPVEDVEGEMKILDIGPNTIDAYNEIIKKSGTIIWNGPLGLYELSPFKDGTKKIGKAIAESNADTIIGGGDTIDACKQCGLDLEKFTHVSTGGGAMIEFLEGPELPAIQVLLN